MASAISSGPVCMPYPSLMAVSMSSARAIPSISTCIASLSIGRMVRVVMKPGYSNTSTGVFPIRRANALTSSNVSSEVFMPRTISTSGTCGTGFRKCIPMIRSGRLLASASLLRLSVAVFEMKTASSFPTE